MRTDRRKLDPKPAPAARADVRDRTGNLRFTRAMLYQLSYVGLEAVSYRRIDAVLCGCAVVL